jgi:hypothetical protein
LLDFSKKQLGQPTQAIRLHDLLCGELASRHGGQVPTDRAGGVRDTNQTQSDEMLALAPNDVEVEERAAANRNASTITSIRRCAVTERWRGL